jgi:hypothetical protein
VNGLPPTLPLPALLEVMVMLPTPAKAIAPIPATIAVATRTAKILRKDFMFLILSYNN